MNESADLLQRQTTQPFGKASAPDTVLPNPLQSLLFEAVFCADADLPRHWDRLRAALISTELDAMSVQFLPLLYRRLTPGNTDALSQSVRIRYRQTWATNQLLFQSLRTSLETLHAAGVRTLLLKGAALTAAYYRDMGARAMGDFDLLVPALEFDKAIAALAAAGWTSLSSLSSFDERFTHAHTMTDARGNLLDLHTRVLHLVPRRQIDELFWQSSVPLEIQNAAMGDQSRCLCSADLVLHLAVHGLRWTNPPQLRWIPDIAAVLSSGTVDWDRLLMMTREVDASLAVSAALEFLSGNGFAQVPEPVLSSLRAIPVDAGQRRLFELSTRDTFGNFADTLRFHWRIMTQQHGAGALHQKLRLLPAYVTHRMKVRGLGSWLDLFGSDGIFRHLKGKLSRLRHSTGRPQ